MHRRFFVSAALAVVLAACGSSGGDSHTCGSGYAWNGSACADVNECTTGAASCSAHATCTNTVGSFTCACNAGYSGDGVTCSVSDACLAGLANCDANAACASTGGASFTCTCNSGYSGDGVTCSVSDACLAGLANCDAHATCASTGGASFSCTCNSGFTGDGVSCADVNECTSGTAGCDPNATCTNTVGSFGCACNAGYTGDGFTCAVSDACLAGLANCDANATCTSTGGAGFTCACNAGFTGDGVTCADVNECVSTVSFTKTDYGTEQDCIIPEVCLTRGDNQPIYNAAQESGPQTQCNYGPAGTLWARVPCASATAADFGSFLSPKFASCNPPSIVGVDGCLLLELTQARYDIRFGSWTSGGLGGGFSYDRSGPTSVCNEQAICTNLPGSYSCACRAGFTGDGLTCTDVDECANGTAGCDPNATCTNLPGTFRCACNAGWVGDGFGCADIDECAPPVTFTKTDYGTEQDCLTGSVCITRGDQGPIYNALQEYSAELNCSSTSPRGTQWARMPCSSATPADFQTFIDMTGCWPPSMVGEDVCMVSQAENTFVDVRFTSWTTSAQGGGFSYDRRYETFCSPDATCTNLPGSWSCACNPGYTGDGQVCTVSDACLAGVDNCDPNATCTSTGGATFTCACNPGYTGDGVTCADVDECALGTAVCDPTATCVNTVGSYLCLCPNPLTFTKTNFGTEQDCLAPGVCITRGDQYSIYNALVDTYGPMTGTVYPTGTLWATGTCASAPTSFGPFLSASFANDSPSSMVGVAGCMLAETSGLHFDVTFLSWTGGGGGGGFSYSRTDYVPGGAACP